MLKYKHERLVQLVERYVDIVEVVGSSPISLTIKVSKGVIYFFRLLLIFNNKRKDFSFL